MNKGRGKPTVLEFVEALENEAMIYRKGINVNKGITKLDIKDCLRWTERLIKDFKKRDGGEEKEKKEVI